ncbi:EAL domain-containing protein [Sporosarcina sp. Te-1]|nr:EAL domain-containing protein [Sporosarcina sp. Te-1]
MYPENARDSEWLLKYADLSLYHAKSEGRGNFQFYDSTLHKRIERKMTLHSELRKAIRQEQFTLYYQPKVDLNSRAIVGMEALLRWDHPELGMISPGEFIPIAEESGDIIEIGDWAIKSACLQTKQWQQAGWTDLLVSVNVSVRQIQHSDFVDMVKARLQESGLAPDYLEIELTESIVQNLEVSTQVLDELKKIGVTVSIDDFGTGYSSFSVLQQLPLDVIKIDRSFTTWLTKPL